MKECVVHTCLQKDTEDCLVISCLSFSVTATLIFSGHILMVKKILSTFAWEWKIFWSGWDKIFCFVGFFS